jgi:hypothetical protein
MRKILMCLFMIIYIVACHDTKQPIPSQNVQVNSLSSTKLPFNHTEFQKVFSEVFSGQTQTPHIFLFGSLINHQRFIILLMLQKNLLSIRRM